MLGQRNRQKKNHIISDSIYIKYPEKTDRQQKDLWLLGGEGRNWEVIVVEQEGSFGVDGNFLKLDCDDCCTTL